MTAIPASLFVQFIQLGCEKGLLKDIIKTLDGEYYCSAQYLEEKIAELVEKNGKINVENIAEHFCIEQTNVNRIIQRMSANKRWTVFDDLILTQNFVRDVERDLRSQIVESGSLSIIAQTQRMKLPYSLLKSIFDNNTSVDDDYVRYSQVPDVVSTKTYIDNCKMSILNALELYDEPYPMFKLQKSQDIQEDMFYLLLEQIVKDENFDLGLLRGKRSRAIFEPNSYKARQLSLIRSIFDSNDCISKFDNGVPQRWLLNIL
ncbi:E3 UFM1-protein ligase 1 [Parasitella parasitica]|nr:E3 UFM1-protein ligase 1 [Parasitella parasitica]